MADEPSPTADASTSRRDLITTGLMASAALAAIGGFGLLFSLWWQTGITDDYEVLRIASQEFVNGRPIVAGELAATVEFEEDVDPLDEQDADRPAGSAVDGSEETPEQKAVRQAREERQEWIRLRDFLVGAGNVARAESVEDLRERRKVLNDAIPYLIAVRDGGGFPPGRQTEGYRVLGESLYQVGRYDDAIEALTQAIRRDPTLKRDLLPALAESQRNSTAALTSQALATIEEFLGDVALQPPQRWQGELTRIRSLIGLKRWRDADQAIARARRMPRVDEISLQGAEVEFRDNLSLLWAVLRIEQAIDRYGARPQDEFADRSPAIAALEETLQNLSDLQREASPSIAAQARLSAARAFLVQGLFEDALNQLTVVRQQRPFGAEAIVGGLEEIELLADQGRGVEMLQTTRYVMRELGDASGFDASLITFDEFRRRLAGAIEQLRRTGDYENAIDTSRSLPPVFDLSEALTFEGSGYREWAAATIDDGTDIAGRVARSSSVLARSRYRAAGDAFAEAAELQFDTEQYISTLWSAIDAYQKGRHFSRSIRLLEPYLRFEQRRRQPRGLVAYGRALLAENEPERAIDALNACIVEFERDPLRYDARLMAALAYAELGDIENARRLLRDNLDDGELAPQNPTWRDSLFALGELLYERGYQNYLSTLKGTVDDRARLLRQNQPILEEAIRSLDEAVERYWPMSRARSAAYLSARAHVMSATWPRLESKSPEILDAARRSLRLQADQELQTALDGFVNLRKHLVTREEEQRLPDGEQAMLRNCFVAEADVLREMNQLEDAAGAYRAIELRYMNEPPALEAILGRARCVKELGRVQEANLLFRQASVVLSRIPGEWDGKFAEVSRYDRPGWGSVSDLDERTVEQSRNVGNGRSVTAAFSCPHSRSPPAIPASRGRER